MTKRYLKTPEEAIDALQAGKKIEAGDFEYRLVGEVIIAINKTDKSWAVNAGIYLDDIPFIDEPEHLKIEVGKLYETRDHQKARCYKCVRHLFFFTIDNVGNFSTMINGNYNINGVTSNLDIIGPWEE